jgi:MOSC domain-containing protein YiiM
MLQNPAHSPLQTTVLAVHRDGTHRFSKLAVPAITLQAGWGVVGDAHHGRTVRHRSRVKANPDQPNLRQVHVITQSLLDHVATLGFAVAPGQLGENITIAAAAGLAWQDLIALPVGTQLRFAPAGADLGAATVIELTGLRNPCQQIDDFQPGLLQAMLGRTDDGRLLRKTGVMATVLQSGKVAACDHVSVHLPAPPHQAMERV